MKEARWVFIPMLAIIVVLGLQVWRDHVRRPAETPYLAIQRLHLPDGLTGICGVDKDGLLIHVKIAVYDSQGNFVAQGESSHAYECAAVPGMRAGDYWVALFR